jgi:hypothetical protein
MKQCKVIFGEDDSRMCREGIGPVSDWKRDGNSSDKRRTDARKE